ncbi:MAG TPA: phosphatase [Opitutus sp.]|nr:phosphatase [Opitutus sp.]
MSSPAVSVIDIGSNSIKTLVAKRSAAGAIEAIATHTLDARISAGISQARPRLTDESMQRGLAAIRELLAFSATHNPTRIVLVATSAVRDAENGAAFREQVRAATGHDIRILSGTEEASLIGRGLTCDPALGDLRDFFVFDLGGGSLECLSFADRRLQHAASFQLGCVRLTEKFVADSTQPLSDTAIAAIAAHTKATLAASNFPLPLPAAATAVGTGGTITTLRAILAARANLSLEAISPIVELAAMRTVLSELSAFPLAQRKQIQGLPPARADIFPAALATLIALAEAADFLRFRHSLYNLRYGLAAELLQ